jgi:predicted peroxiredoxin
MQILIVSISGEAEAIKDIRGISSASVSRGHSVTIFLTGDGVNHLRDGERLAEFSSMGVRLLACRTSARDRGVALDRELPKGVEMSSLTALIELMESSDRAVFL